MFGTFLRKWHLSLTHRKRRTNSREPTDAHIYPGFPAVVGPASLTQLTSAMFTMDTATKMMRDI